MRPWSKWDHILKIDPDKELVAGETFADVCETGTDALMIGGTTGITPEKMERVVAACSEYDLPLYLEPNAPEVAIDADGLDGYLVPAVFNTRDPMFLVGAHKEWAKMNDVNSLPWDRIVTEAYIVLNPDASAASYTDANCDLTGEDVASYATVAERLFGQEIIYIEYSGMLGDPAIVDEARAALDEATLFYGGGIHDYESAHTMASVADVIIVGDLVHDVGVDAVEETVDAAADAA